MNNSRIRQTILSLFTLLIGIAMVYTLFEHLRFPRPVEAVPGTLKINASIGSGLFPGGVWTSSGNVGIGTTAPLDKVDINGSLAVGSLPANALPQSNSLYVSGNVGIGTTAPGNLLDVAGTIGSSKYADRANSNYFLSPAASTNSLLVAGNVGIGTTGPGTLLDVAGGVVRTGNNTSTALRGFQAGTGLAGLTLQGYGDCQGQAGIFHNAYELGDPGCSGATTYKWMGTHASFGSRAITMGYGSGINFFADNVATTADTSFTPTQRMIITNTGSVGIGTTSPGYELDVEGSAHAPLVYAHNAQGWSQGNELDFQGPAYSMFGNLRLNGNDVSRSVYQNTLNATLGLGANGGDILFMGGAGGGTEIMRIKNGGNVGIGTNNPISKLSIYQGSAMTNQSSSMTVYGGSTTTTVGSYSYPAEIQTSNSNLGRLQFAGYRKYNPTNDWGGAGFRIQYAVDSSYTGGDLANIYLGAGNGYGGQIALSTGGTETMTLQNGYVGIGTAGPGYKLDVAGNASVESGYVKMGNGYAVGTRSGSNYRIEAGSNSGCIVSILSTAGNNGWYCTIGVISFAVAFTATPYMSATAHETGTTGAAGSYVGVYSSSNTGFILQVTSFWNNRPTTPVDWIAYGPTTATNFDLAESYKTKDQTISSGDVVCVDPNNNSNIIKCQNPYDPTAIGIVSTNPGLIVGDDLQANSRLVGLQGRVPVKVTLENGPIKRGDPLTPSATKPGYAMKATKAGQIIGKALQPFDGNSTVLGENAFDGLTKNQIQKIINSTKATGEGQTMAFINISWYDPDAYLTSTGDLKIVGDNSGNFTLQHQDGSTIDRVGAFAEAIIAKLGVGLLDVQKLTIKGTPLDAYLTNFFSPQTQKINSFEQKVKQQQSKIDDSQKQIEQLKSIVCSDHPNATICVQANP